jgi:hypothetical protein
MRKVPEYLTEVVNKNKLVWIRKCPKCKKNIYHKNFASAKTCHKQNRLCYDCGCWNKGLTKYTNKSIKGMSIKLSKSMKKLRKSVPPWNFGLSKDNNSVIKRMANNHLGFRHTNETKKLIGRYSKNFWKNKEYRERVIQKLKEIIGDPEHIHEWRLKMEYGGYFTPLELKSDFERYKNEVLSFTRKNDISLLDNHNKRGRCKYHLDHKYSITQGFLNDIPSKIVGSIHNLEMIYHKDNIIKNSKCSITKEKLLQLYYDSENKI